MTSSKTLSLLLSLLCTVACQPQPFSFFTMNSSYFDALGAQAQSNASCDFQLEDKIAFYCDSGYIASHPLNDFISNTVIPASPRSDSNFTAIPASKAMTVYGVKAANVDDNVVFILEQSFIVF